MSSERKPRVLFVYYTYTQQALKIVDVMGTTLQERGWDVHRAAIEFTDPRYVERFSQFPWRHPVFGVTTMLLPQFRRATGEIRIPDEVRDGDYDLICIGSPTWWLTTCMPIRSFLKSEEAHRLLDGKDFAGFVVCRRYWKNNLDTVKKLGTECGGRWIDGTRFTYLGNQVRSLLSLVSYLGTGEYRDRYVGVKIPPTNLQAEHLEAARAFAMGLADRLSSSGEPAATPTAEA